MMLSEHREALNQRLTELKEEFDLEQVIDEQQLEEWQNVLETAAKKQDLQLRIIYGKEKKEIIGHLIAWDSNQQMIYIEDDKEERTKITFKEIKYFESYY